MERTILATIALVTSVMFAAAQPAKESYQPGLGEFMTATSFATRSYGLPAKQNNGSSLLMRLTRSRKAWRTPQGCIQPLTAFLSPR